MAEVKVLAKVTMYEWYMFDDNGEVELKDQAHDYIKDELNNDDAEIEILRVKSEPEKE